MTASPTSGSPPPLDAPRFEVCDDDGESLIVVQASDYDALLARVDDLERENRKLGNYTDDAQEAALKAQRDSDRVVAAEARRAEAAEAEVARLTAQIRVRMTSPKCSGCGDDICTLDHGRAELLAAEVARLRTALREIGYAETGPLGPPAWKIAREVLKGDG